MKPTWKSLAIRAVFQLERIAETLVQAYDHDKHAFRMYDTDRAQVYTKNLGERLRLADTILAVAEKQAADATRTDNPREDK